ncbi:MAG: very short patch repair endonuclease [Proteobacteria bacterium]|nr:very short patch repair endonuclease [Pseudomonadota bacterium]
MPDVFTKAKRSDVMSRIRSRGNANTELALVRVFRANGITGWRRQVKLVVESRESSAESRRVSSPRLSTLGSRLAVRPDFVFPKLRLAVFVDGCFWHGCPRHGTQPKGNGAFWRKKLAANVARDRRVNRALRRSGWRVLRIWEHALKWTAKQQAKGGLGAEGRLLQRVWKAMGAAGRGK